MPFIKNCATKQVFGLFPQGVSQFCICSAVPAREYHNTRERGRSHSNKKCFLPKRDAPVSTGL